MLYTKKMRMAFLIILPSIVILLLLLIAFMALPLLQISTNDMRVIGLQQTRANAFAKNALILAYRTDSFTTTQAIGDMEVSIPQFEAAQAAMAAYNDPGLAALVAGSHTDFLAIDTAVKLILANTAKSVDHTQIDIILVHSHTYSATMTLASSALQQAAYDVTLHIFCIETGIDLVIVALVVAFSLNIKSIANKIRCEHEALSVQASVGH